MTGASSPRHQGRIEPVLVGLLFVGLAVATFLFGSRTWLPELASRHGAGMDRTLIFLLVATGLMFLIGHFVLGYFVFRFGRADSATPGRASAKMERGWSIVLALMMVVVGEGGVLAVGLPAWKEYFATAPPEDSWLVEVTSEQFAWNIRYPGEDGELGRTDPTLIKLANPIGIDPEDPYSADDRTAINQIHVPVNRPVRVRLRAKDVIHSFFLPHLRVKQDAVPGMTIDVWFVPTKEGQYELACTELCGLGHYRMRGFFNVLSEQEFAEWSGEGGSKPETPAVEVPVQPEGEQKNG